MHWIETSQPILEPEDGLMLGNGDLSVSVYQASDHLVWRFGKVDVWDRRIDLDRDPEPTHIDEIRRGIREEGWVSKGYRESEVTATSEVADVERMKEACTVNPSYALSSYPCPKPVGELWMHLPMDKHGMKINQRLCIERSELEISITWTDGGEIKLLCFVHPKRNVLVVNWEVHEWNALTAIGHQVPVWFNVYRWADPTIEQFRFELYRKSRNRSIRFPETPGDCTPLPAPSYVDFEGRWVIEQTFFPDLEFTEGFKYFMMPFITDGFNIDPVTEGPSDDKAIQMWANDDVLTGAMCVAIPCSSDDGGCEAEASRFVADLADLKATFRRWHHETLDASEDFWSRSSIEMDDKTLERTWYETVYLRRCTYRADKIAPGLGLPSTVQDYSMWHGDYHMNFNYQQPFYGDYGSNHIEIGDSHFPGLEYMFENGRDVAEKYWNCRGTYMALSGYPFKVASDPFGCGPLSRLAYCTGWAMNHYWSRFLHTWDVDWLREVGYRTIKDCALFFLDFLDLRDDGKYHAFPSVQGESFYTGKEEDYTDQPQVIRNAQYCLRSAIKAAKVLGVDEDLQVQWQERVDKLVDAPQPDQAKDDPDRYYLNPPQFISMDNEDLPPRKGDPTHEMRMTVDSHMWKASFNMLPWLWMIRLRNDAFTPETNLAQIRAHIDRWRRPSGQLRSMTVSDLGYIGAYGESMGVIAPIQEMMLQSWDGSIQLFPAWDPATNGKFTTLRAEGAFLVSCAFEDGHVRPVSIFSEAGQPCRLKNPWDSDVIVVDGSGSQVDRKLSDGYITFATEPGVRYDVAPEDAAYSVPAV